MCRKMGDESRETVFFSRSFGHFWREREAPRYIGFPFKVRRGGTSVSSRGPSGPVPLLRRQDSRSHNLKKKKTQNKNLRQLKLKVFLLAAADG